MKSKLVAQSKEERMFVLVLDPGDEVAASVKTFAGGHSIRGASITAIGAFASAELAWFDTETRSYVKIPLEQQTEVLSLVGDIALDDKGIPSLHMHVVLGLRDGQTRGGHLVSARVKPTLEMVITEVSACIRRKSHPELGLALIDLGKSENSSTP